MIRYELSCDKGHTFEGWFGSADDFDRQQKMALVSCPSCGSTHVAKRLMAPSVSTARKKQQRQELAVQTGQRGSGLVQIVSGPAAGARVVQNAASFLLDGDLVKPVETAAQPAPKTPAGAK